MFKHKLWVIGICALTLGGLAPRAHAQWAVVDVGAITQLVQQISYWKQQIQAMSDQLDQAKQTYQSMTGGRGMERLLAGTARNYLPTDWDQLANALQGLSSGYSALSSDLNRAMTANAVLTPSQLASLAPQTQAAILTERRQIALRQALTREALINTSNRFQSIQQLINAIPGAADPKAVFDLQARIQAEIGMLQNEQTKLQTLDRVSLAEERAQEQREWEMTVDGQGRFATRFQPKP